MLPRLKKRREFLTAAKALKAARPGLVLQMQPGAHGDDPPHIGFTASKKVGNAVRRNRAKRRLRALAEEVLAENGHSGAAYVLIARAKTLDASFEDLRRDLLSALKQIHKKAEKS